MYLFDFLVLACTIMSSIQPGPYKYSMLQTIPLSLAYLTLSSDLLEALLEDLACERHLVLAHVQRGNESDDVKDRGGENKHALGQTLFGDPRPDVLDSALLRYRAWQFLGFRSAGCCSRDDRRSGRSLREWLEFDTNEAKQACG